MTRRSDGTTIVALYHIVSGFLSLFTLCLVLSIPLIVGIAVPASNDPNAGTAVVITGIIGLLIGAIFLLIAIANWVVGWGLWERQEWARLGAIGLAFLRLINIPLGTIIGGLIIWHLLRDETKAEFAAK